MAFNIIGCPTLDVKAILDQAVTMLQPTRYIAERGPDTLLQSLVGRCHQDRDKSFDLFLSKLRKLANPLVIETGCIRAEEDFSAGYSTYLFGLFLRYHGGKLISVDLDANHCNLARRLTTGLPVEVVTAHSHDFFRNYEGAKINALYLDSHDADLPGHEENCLEEARLALPFLADDGLILIDDTPYHHGRFHGKGATAIPWLLEQGFSITYAGYQVLLSRFTNF